MKRSLLFAVLALALPNVLSATSIFTPGVFASGTSTGSDTTNLSFTVNGNLASITVNTGGLTPLSACPPGGSGTCFSFSSGAVMVTQGGSLVFESALNSGTIDQEGSSTFLVTFSLTPGPNVPPGSEGQSIFVLTAAPPAGSFAGTMRFGSSTVVLAAEPSSLGLLGVGMIGLASMVRWKRRAQGPYRPHGEDGLLVRPA